MFGKIIKSIRSNIAPTAEDYLQKGSALEDKGELAEACECYQKAADMGLCQAAIFAAKCYDKMGKHPEAGKMMEKAHDMGGGQEVDQHIKLYRQIDGLKRIPIHTDFLETSSLLQLCDLSDRKAIEDIIPKFESIIKNIGELYFPTENDYQTEHSARRDIGLCKYMLLDTEKATIEEHQQIDSELSGVMIVDEILDARPMMAYLYNLYDLYKKTEDIKYVQREYQFSLEIYESEMYNKISNNDLRRWILMTIVIEKIEGRFCEQDLRMAYTVNEEIRQLGDEQSLSIFRELQSRYNI